MSNSYTPAGHVRLSYDCLENEARLHRRRADMLQNSYREYRDRVENAGLRQRLKYLFTGSPVDLGGWR